MPGKRFFNGTTAEIFADFQFAPIDAPIIMTSLASPPRIHPVTAQRPSAPQIKLRAEVRNQGCVVKQVGFQSHVERFADWIYGIACDYRITQYDSIASNDLHRIPVFDDNGIALWHDRNRQTFDSANDMSIGTTHFRKEVLVHVPPCPTTAQHPQPAFATIYDCPAFDDPLRCVMQNIQYFIPIRHVGRCDHTGQLQPIHTA